MEDRDNECALRENYSDEAPRLAMKGFLEVHFENMNRVTEVRLGDEARCIQFFQRVRDPFGLGTRKAALFQIFDEAVGVEHQSLHRLSVYQLLRALQGANNLLY